MTKQNLVEQVEAMKGGLTSGPFDAGYEKALDDVLAILRRADEPSPEPAERELFIPADYFQSAESREYVGRQLQSLLTAAYESGKRHAVNRS
jgi:hypothetical protein